MEETQTVIVAGPALARALRLLAKVVPSPLRPRPNLDGAYLSAGFGEVQVRGTDGYSLDVSVRLPTRAGAGTEVSMFIPRHIWAGLPKTGGLIFSLIDDLVTVETASGGTRTWPNVEAPDRLDNQQLLGNYHGNPGPFMRALELATVATDKKPRYARPILQGIAIRQTGPTTTVISTDGFRVMMVPGGESLLPLAGTIIPPSVVSLLLLWAKLYPITPDTEWASWVNGQEIGRPTLVIGDATVRIWCRTVEGTYPNIQEALVVHQHPAVQMTIDGEQFFRALEEATAGRRVSAGSICEVDITPDGITSTDVASYHNNDVRQEVGSWDTESTWEALPAPSEQDIKSGVRGPWNGNAQLRMNGVALRDALRAIYGKRGPKGPLTFTLYNEPSGELFLVSLDLLGGGRYVLVTLNSE